MNRPPAVLDQLVDRNSLPFFAAARGYRTMLEVGTYRGEYAEFLLTHWAGTLHTVDPWISQPPAVYLDGCATGMDMDEIMADALRRLDPWIKAGSCRIMRMLSERAAATFVGESLDVVYLDGSHEYTTVDRELRLFWPLIRSGGLLGGHDFYSRNDSLQRADVANAVLDFGEAIGVRPSVKPCSSWFFLK